MIKIEGLTKKFGDFTLFENMNMEIPDGAFVVVTGRSGCGKTTLLNIIGGLERVTAGSVIVDGLKIEYNSGNTDYYRKKIGFLFQNFALVERKTVRQNLELVHKSARSGVGIEQALEMTDLADRIDEKVYRLSGGEQQRVALARLIVKKCSVILADEPTGSLDRENADKVMDILQKLNKSGKTVILVTHNEDYKRLGSINLEM